MNFTQSELKAAATATANTPDAPRSCGHIVKGGKRWLLFPHKNGNLYAVKERTQAQINKHLHGRAIYKRLQRQYIRAIYSAQIWRLYYNALRC